MIKLSLLSVLAATVLPLGGAVVVNVDFQGVGGVVADGGGSAVLSALGGYWNVQGASGEAGLFSADGGATAARVWTSGFTGSRVLGDAMYADYLVGSVELRGLDAGASYEIVLYGAANLQTQFEVAAPWVMTPESAAHADDCLYWDTALPGVEGCDYVRGLASADASGTIAIQVGRGAIAGLQIDLAHNPEPGVMMMMGLAFALLAIRRRR